MHALASCSQRSVSLRVPWSPHACARSPTVRDYLHAHACRAACAQSRSFGAASGSEILCALAIFSGPIAGSRWGTKGLREAVRTETLLATATRVNTEDINNHRRQTIDGHLSDRNHGTVQPGFSKSGIHMQKMCLLAAQNIEHLLCEYRSLVLPGGHPQRGQPLRRIH